MIRSLVEEKNTYKVGDQGERPWGTYLVTHVGEGFTTKTISVNSGGVLSDQMHTYRNEHWFVVSGRGSVELQEDGAATKRSISLNAGSNVDIPRLTWHRLRNVGGIPLVFIEVQTGPVLDESDIRRRDDIYGRVSESDSPSTG